jgi:hypothetical protein
VSLDLQYILTCHPERSEGFGAGVRRNSRSLAALVVYVETMRAVASNTNPIASHIACRPKNVSNRVQ